MKKEFYADDQSDFKPLTNIVRLATDFPTLLTWDFISSGMIMMMHHNSGLIK